MFPQRDVRVTRRNRSRRRQLICQTLENRIVLSATIGNNIGVGDDLQNYRLAIAATAEYTAFFGGQAQALTAIQTFVSNVNEIFETELSVHLDLVSDTNTIFTNGATDGYSNGSTNSMLNQNTAILDGVLTNAAYDIGHVFGTTGSGGSGLAGLGVVNSVTRKGEGASVSSNPQGPGWVSLVGHELAHQFGAQHTFNANAFGSAIGNRSGSNAYEPASGSTLQSYAGISDDVSGDDNLQQDPDPYFHSASFEQVQTYIAGAGTPNSTTATGNNIPTVSGGTDYTIPAGTPFELAAVGADGDAGDTLTYTWEQLDLGPAMSLPLTDNGSSPLFRAFEGTTDSNRVFPRLSDLVNNVNTAAIGEVLPTTTRDLNFRATVRDGNNGVNSDDVLVSVVNTGTPFSVTSPNTAVNWTGGASQTISWDVGGSDANGINVANVAIDLSLDGGLTYPFELTSSTANDGSHTLNAPNINATDARIRVRGIGNVFFDISDTNFSITADAGAAGVTVTESGGDTLVSEDGVVGGAGSDSYTVALNTAPAGTVSVTVNADAQTEVSTDNVNFSSSVVLAFTSTTGQTVFVRGLDDSVQEGIHSGTVTQMVTASSDANYPNGTLINPVVTSIADDELQPVVGVDLDQASGTSPTNWTRVSQTFGGTTSNLIREDGITTGIGLTLGVSGSAGLNVSSPNATPLHSPPLDAIDGNHLASESLTLTWTGLTAGTDYNLYLLLTENFGSNVTQSVTITGGAGNPLPFTQDTQAIGNGLLVNSGLANPTKTLEADAVIAQADASGEIKIVVVDTSPGGSGNAMLAGAAIQEVGPSAIGFSVIQSGDSTTVGEAGTTDTFDVVLTSQPTGNVVIDVTSGDTDEATVGPASLTFDNTNWNVPQTVTVTGVDDALADGAQTSTTTISINAVLTLDDAFDSVGDRLLSVVTQDNEATPLVGVDFDDTGAAPANWTSVNDQFGSVTNNLVNEDGTATAFDLTVAISGGANVVNTSAPSNLPDHTPSLADLDGLRFASGSITLTWADLSPGTEYDLWLFVAENFSQTFIQTVTISGGGTNPPVFTMDTTTVGGNTLLVNAAVANAANNLQVDAVRASADPSGNIQIVVANNGGNFVGLSGAAIQEVAAVPLDFGDAPTAAQSGFANSYPVTVADDGARHGALGPRLGPNRDFDTDGLPAVGASGDDADNIDDEDGVLFGVIQEGAGTAAVDVFLENATNAKLDAWIDFDRDGIWETNEQIFDDFGITNLVQTLNFTLPASATAGDTYARVRVSSAGNLDPTGEAVDGEVEDHLVTILSSAPVVESIVVNQGDVQRSSLDHVTLTFDRVVQLAGDPFQFTNTTTTGAVVDVPSVTELNGKTVVDFAFTPGVSVGVSGTLLNGDYELVVDATLVTSLGASLDGSGNGTGGNHVYGDDPVDNFFRKYGDDNGNDLVDLLDFAAFRQTFGKTGADSGYKPGFDSDGDGIIGLLDFAAFRQGFGT